MKYKFKLKIKALKVYFINFNYILDDDYFME